jgi:hypothetical protein
MGNTVGNLWDEYNSAARWCAARGLKGAIGDALPEGISGGCWALIDMDTDAFAGRVSDYAYALSAPLEESPDL